MKHSKKSYSLILLLVLISLINVEMKPLNPKQVVWAVDCGAKQARRSGGGFMYKADTGYKGGLFIDYSDNKEISQATWKYTNDQFIYMTERHGHGSFSYDIPLTNSGRYVLILKFSENWHHEPRSRVFNIKLGSQRVLEGVDILSKVGRFAELSEYIQFDFNNGQVFHDGRVCQNAWDPNTQNLIVEFEKTNIDNPKVDALILYQGELSETDYYDIPKLQETWEKKVEAEARRKEEEKLKKEESKLQQREKIKIRNDHLDDFDDDVEDITEFESFENPLVIYLKNSPGLLLSLIAVIVLIVSYVFLNVTNKGSIVSSASGAAADFADKTAKKVKQPVVEKKKKN